MIEAVLLQPQSVSLGVPIAGIGLIFTTIQITNMLGASNASRVTARFGEAQILFLTPVVIVASLVLLAAFQVLPALLFIVVMGFFTSLMRPMLLGRIQREVSDEVRATVISMQSLMFTICAMVAEPALGYIAEHSGLPVAYVVLAGCLTVLMGLLFWAGRKHLTATTTATEVVWSSPQPELGEANASK
jgi:MFS family permease